MSEILAYLAALFSLLTLLVCCKMLLVMSHVAERLEPFLRFVEGFG